MQAFSLSTPFNMCVTGSSGTGKTVWTCRLIRQISKLSGHEFSSVIYCYAIWQPEYTKLKRDLPFVEFRKGLPEFLLGADDARIGTSGDKESIDEMTMSEVPVEHTLLIIDDLAYECRKVD